MNDEQQQKLREKAATVAGFLIADDVDVRKLLEPALIKAVSARLYEEMLDHEYDRETLVSWRSECARLRALLDKHRIEWRQK